MQLKKLARGVIVTKAALDAVKTWRYHPVLVNGKPTRVTTTITASFRIQ